MTRGLMYLQISPANLHTWIPTRVFAADKLRWRRCLSCREYVHPGLQWDRTGRELHSKSPRQDDDQTVCWWHEIRTMSAPKGSLHDYKRFSVTCLFSHFSFKSLGCLFCSELTTFSPHPMRQIIKKVTISAACTLFNSNSDLLLLTDFLCTHIL